jgi:uncharacterized membrane protein YeaQ/YmgE (transglycosylase-associated protein family)
MSGRHRWNLRLQLASRSGDPLSRPRVWIICNDPCTLPDAQRDNDPSANPQTATDSLGITKGNAMEHGLIAWLIIGAIAGFLAGKIVEGSGFGLIVDIIVGIIGAVIGGYLTGAMGIGVGGGLIASIIVAVIGAVVLLLVLRLIKRVA